MPVTDKGAGKTALSETELNERIAILKKLRNHLQEQRNRFYSYLDLLEHEQEDILSHDADKLKIHADMEKAIVEEIYNFQKVIDPLEDMYHVAYPHTDVETDQLKESLQMIQEEVLVRNQRNQQLLQERMEEVRNEISSIRKFNKNRPVYSAETETPSMIDIST